MKKIFILTVLLVICGDLFAFTTQGVWRWRKDDGSETSATWIAAQNTSFTTASRDSTIRLRFELYNDPNNAGGDLNNAELEDSSKWSTGSGDKKWKKITLAAGTEPFMLAGSSSFVTDLQPTTKQLAGQAFTFQPGKIILAHELLPKDTLLVNTVTEYEWAIKPTANLKAGTIYYFRVAAANYPKGSTKPFLFTASVLPISLASFSVHNDNGHVQLQWTTATELNCNRFEIERSSDGTSWVRIGTVNGNGTSSKAHTYQSSDINPLNGNNYYRLKQYDMDGSFTVSDVRSLKMLLQAGSSVIVYPNPAKGLINFTLQHFTAGNITATLSTMSGNIIHQETITVSDAAANYKLNMKKQPAPGMYILQLKGESLSETIKVMVQ